jgi:type III secretory pathway component EscS
MMQKEKKILQLIWGIILIGAGIGIFVAMPQKMAQLQQAGHTDFFVLLTRLCFYLIAILLMGGGAKKIYGHYMDTFEDAGGDRE